MQLLLRWENEELIAQVVAEVDVAHAPELAEPELLSALSRRLRRGELTEERATEALATFDQMPIVLHRHSGLRARVWELKSDRLTAYDAIFLALAEALDVPLVTLDRGLARTAAEYVAVLPA